jgi:hypothetical protein
VRSSQPEDAMRHIATLRELISLITQRTIDHARVKATKS